MVLPLKSSVFGAFLLAGIPYLKQMHSCAGSLGCSAGHKYRAVGEELHAKNTDPV